MTKARDLSQTPNTNFSFRNRIINGAMEIWQRGTSITGTNYVFGADRFQAYGYATNSVTLSQQSALGSLDGFSNFMRIASTNSRVFLFQRVENLKRFSGQTLTFSFYAKSSDIVSLESFTHLNYGSGGSSIEYNTPSSATTTFNLTSSWQRFTHTFTIPNLLSKTFGADNTSLLEIGLQSGSGDIGTLDITGVQLEVGSIATPFEHRPYGTELALCQRYCMVYGGNQVYERAGGTGSSFSATGAAMQITPLVTMRASPSVSVSSVSNWGIELPGVASQTATGISMETAATSQNSFYVAVQHSSNGSMGGNKACVLRAENTTSARLTLSAEL